MASQHEYCACAGRIPHEFQPRRAFLSLTLPADRKHVSGQEPEALTCGYLRAGTLSSKSECAAVCLLPTGGEDARVGGLRAGPDRRVERQRGGCVSRLYVARCRNSTTVKPSARGRVRPRGSSRRHHPTPEQASSSRPHVAAESKSRGAKNASRVRHSFPSAVVLKCKPL